MSDSGEVDILVIEDNPDDVDMTLRALRKANKNSHVRIARDGAEALEFIFGKEIRSGENAESMPKLILLDLKLPKIDGFEVLQRIKGDPRTQLIPVVVLTSSAEQRDVVESYQLGVNSYIVKPVSFEDFVETVGKLGLYWLQLNQAPT